MKNYIILSSLSVLCFSCLKTKNQEFKTPPKINVLSIDQTPYSTQGQYNMFDTIHFVCDISSQTDLTMINVFTNPGDASDDFFEFQVDTALVSGFPIEKGFDTPTTHHLEFDWPITESNRLWILATDKQGQMSTISHTIIAQ